KARARGGVAEAIVGGPLVVGGEDRVGLGGFLEALLRDRITLVAIGVMRERELLERGLDLDRRGGAGNSEDFVVVALLAHRRARQYNPLERLGNPGGASVEAEVESE